MELIDSFLLTAGPSPVAFSAVIPRASAPPQLTPFPGPATGPWRTLRFHRNLHCDLQFYRLPFAR